MAQGLRVLSREPRFNSQHSHGSSQLSLTPVPGDPVPTFGLLGQQAHVILRHTFKQNTHTHKKF